MHGCQGLMDKKNVKPLVKICQIASEICQTEAGRRLSVLNYPNEQRRKCDVTLEPSLEALHVNTVLISSAISLIEKS